MIAPHTLANFQSLPKLIIIKPHYRGDWQIALIKQNELEDWLLPR